MDSFNRDLERGRVVAHPPSLFYAIPRGTKIPLPRVPLGRKEILFLSFKKLKNKFVS